MLFFSDLFSLPFVSNTSLYYNKNLEIFLNKYSDEYKLILQSFKSEGIIDEYEELRHTYELDQNISKIKEIFTSFLKYQRLSSITAFNKLLDNNKYYIDALNQVHTPKSLDLYRIRTDIAFETDKLSNKKYCLFHIPFNKQFLVSSGRFNPQGFPCLYTSSSFEVAFNEVLNSSNADCNIIESLNVGNFTNSNLINIVDFTLRDINQLLKDFNSNTIDKKNLFSYLNLYPIIASCHSKVSYDNSFTYINFKIEHLFPSLVIDWFLELYNSNSRTDTSSRPYFLKYSSVHATTPSSAHNFAFFTQPHNGTDDYCPYLSSLFIEDNKHIYCQSFKGFPIPTFSKDSPQSNISKLSEFFKSLSK